MRHIVGLIAALVICAAAHAATLADLSNSDASGGLKQACASSDLFKKVFGALR